MGAESEPLSQGYSLRQVAEVLGLPAARVRALASAAGLAAPFGFAEVVVLRALAGLAAARVSPRKLRGALAKLGERGQALAGVRLAAHGKDVVVRDAAGTWDAVSGQGCLDFSAAPPAAAELAPIVELRRKTPAPAPASAPSDDALDAGALDADADAWCARAHAAEASGDAPAALAAFQRAAELAPDSFDAHANLGRLLHECGDLGAAERHTRAAIALAPELAVAHFNLGVLLEDACRPDEATAAYRAAIARDERFADAHFNLGRLLERSGDRVGALRHLSRYRALSR